MLKLDIQDLEAQPCCDEIQKYKWRIIQAATSLRVSQRLQQYMTVCSGACLHACQAEAKAAA